MELSDSVFDSRTRTVAALQHMNWDLSENAGPEDLRFALKLDEEADFCVYTQMTSWTRCLLIKSPGFIDEDEVRALYVTLVSSRSISVT